MSTAHPMSAATGDPVRAQVEAALRTMVDTVAGFPCDLVRRSRETAQRGVERVADTVTTSFGLARTIGELTFGSLLGLSRAAVEPVAGSRPPSDRPALAAITKREPAASGEPPGPGADALPLEDYESLAASHVVARLTRLSPHELEQIRRFEEAHRGRRTILGKIEQLLDA